MPYMEDLWIFTYIFVFSSQNILIALALEMYLLSHMGHFYDTFMVLFVVFEAWLPVVTIQIHKLREQPDKLLH